MLILSIIHVFLILTTLLVEPIMITISPDMNKVIFDGKWTFYTEWKRSSLNSLIYEDGYNVQLRTAHQDNFIYVLIDAVSAIHPNKIRDNAMICITKNYDKPTISNIDDYCFVVTLDGKSYVLQGGSPLGFANGFQKITTPDGFVGVGGVSNNNDRYSQTPHSSYEFKIPLDTIGRSDKYGFYVSLYDSNNNKYYSWPKDLIPETVFKIPSPSLWGDLVSPDKSLPEFPMPFMIALSGIILAIFVSRINSGLHFKVKP